MLSLQREVSSSHPSFPYSPLFMSLSFQESCRVKIECWRASWGFYSSLWRFSAGLQNPLILCSYRVAIEGCCFSHPALVRLLMQCLQADLKTESSAEKRDSIILILQPLLPYLLSQLINFHCTSLQLLSIWVLQHPTAVSLLDALFLSRMTCNMLS